MTTTRLLGNAGEELACRELMRKGWLILAKNYRCYLGEIDIIALDDNTVVFVEVKTRRSTLYGVPIEAVTIKKQARIVQVGQYFLEQHNSIDIAFRVDVVSIVCNSNDTLRSMQIIQNAVLL